MDAPSDCFGSVINECAKDSPYKLWPEQQQALLHLVNAKHSFLSLPTGYGKVFIALHSVNSIAKHDLIKSVNNVLLVRSLN